MPGQHPPGYHGRRARIRSYVLNGLTAAHPDEAARLWAEAEAREAVNGSVGRAAAAISGQQTVDDSSTDVDDVRNGHYRGGR